MSKIDRAVANDKWWGCFPNASIQSFLKLLQIIVPRFCIVLGKIHLPNVLSALRLSGLRTSVVFGLLIKLGGKLPINILPLFVRVSMLVVGLYGLGIELSLVTFNIISRLLGKLFMRFNREVILMTMLLQHMLINLRHHLEQLLKMEELFCFQKSRLKWQLEGDRCTWFFF